MTVDPAVVALVVGGIITAVQTTLGFLTKRSIDAVDKSIGGLSEKVEKLSNADTKLAIELAELRVRVTHLEFLVQNGKGHE
jgi:hypothetical protein